MMASNGGTDNLDDIESVPQDGRSIVSKEEKQLEEDDGMRDTRQKKMDKNQNIKSDPEEKPKNRKRRLDNGKEGDDENECDAGNESGQKSKKSKKNPSKTVLAPEEPTPAPAVAAKNSLLPSVEEVCTEFGLNDVKIQYRDVDYQNLTNYKYFTKHVRPILAKENSKVSTVNVMMLVAAKWREFSSQKPFIELAPPPPPPPPPPAANTKKKAMPTVKEVCVAFGLKDVKIQNNEADDVDLTKYRSFAPYVRSILSKKNPNVSASKMMMLVTAKWREFSSQKLALTEPTSPSPPPSPAADLETKEMPTVQEVCAAYGLKDVKIEYDKVGDENLTDYRSFSQHVRPILSKENPKMPASKILMLVAAKWRELSSQNRSEEETESDENKENEERNCKSKPTRSRATKRKTPVNDDVYDADEEKTENRVTRARSGRNKKNTKGQKNVSAGPKVQN